MQGALGYWSRPFPTKHPLYVGPLLRDMRYPGKPDVLLNLGNKFGERALPGTQPWSRSGSIRRASRARAPVDLGIVADLRLAHRGPHRRRSAAWRRRRGCKEIAAERVARTAAYTKDMLEFRTKIAHENADRTPIDA